MKREAAAAKIQKHTRRHRARKTYNNLHYSVLVLQTGLREMVARKKFRFRKQTKAAIIIQAARETGALKEAKDKLEKHVEELTWRLQLEKHLRTDLEEAKAREVTQLQNSLQEIQSKVDETNALLVKEREAVKKAIEEAPPVIKETQVLVEDTEKINSLKAEVEGLKDSLNSEKERVDDYEKKYNEAQESSAQRGKKLEDIDQAQSKTEAIRNKAAQVAYRELHNARQEALQKKKAEISIHLSGWLIDCNPRA